MLMKSLKFLAAAAVIAATMSCAETPVWWTAWMTSGTCWPAFSMALTIVPTSAPVGMFTPCGTNAFAIWTGESSTGLSTPAILNAPAACVKRLPAHLLTRKLPQPAANCAMPVSVPIVDFGNMSPTTE